MVRPEPEGWVSPHKQVFFSPSKQLSVLKNSRIEYINHRIYFFINEHGKKLYSKRKRESHQTESKFSKSCFNATQIKTGVASYALYWLQTLSGQKWDPAGHSMQGESRLR